MAQETGTWILDANGGVSLPAGDLEEIYDVGGRIGVGIGYAVASRVAIRVDGVVDFLTGSDDAPGAPNLRLWQSGAGVSVSLLDPDRTRWTLLVDAGAGATIIDSDDFPAGAVVQAPHLRNEARRAAGPSRWTGSARQPSRPDEAERAVVSVGPTGPQPGRPPPSAPASPPQTPSGRDRG